MITIIIIIIIIIINTVLIRVKHNITMPIDQFKPIVIILLDLSAIFDTVKHNILFFKLKCMFHLLGKVL